MRKLIARLTRQSYLNKLFFSLITLVLVITLLLATVFSTSYYSSTHRLARSFFFDLLRQSNYSITYINDLSQQLGLSLVYDPNVIAFLNLQAKDDIQTAKTHQTVRKAVLPLSYIDGVYLYNANLDLLLDTKTGFQTDLMGFYDQAVAEKLQQVRQRTSDSCIPFVHDVTFSKRTTKLYSYVLPTYNKDGLLTSAIVINLSVDILTQSLQELNADNAALQFVVSTGNGEVLLHSPFNANNEENDIQKMVSKIMSSGHSEGSLFHKIGGITYLIAYSNANSNGWYLYGLTPYRVIFRPVITTIVLSFLFILFLLGISCQVALRIARYLNRPVETIGQIISENPPPLNSVSEVLQTKEFRSIADAFVKMRKKDLEHSAYRNSTKQIVRRDFLDELLSDNVCYSPEQISQHLKELGCDYLLNSSCLMCLFTIDDYTTFSQNTNPRERNALRFAIINLATELLSENFTCEMIPHGACKFVAILGCPENQSLSEIRTSLEASLKKFLQVIKTHLAFTLTISYGTTFKGVEHLPRMYENLEELLLLRVHYGYGIILTPNMADDLPSDDFRVSSSMENLLVSSILNGNATQAISQFDEIANTLFQCNYNEIMPYLTHLAYHLLRSTKEANASVGQQITEAYKVVSTRLVQCEIESDFRQCFSDYINRICTLLNVRASTLAGQSSSTLADRVVQVIESEYTNPELCLNAIADKLGLSAHYVGQIFRGAYGKSVSQYILDKRLEMLAQNLRETNAAFSEILEQVGFETAQKNYIYTCFKKHFGVTVKTYRTQYRDLS